MKPQQKIEKLKQQIQLREIADDGYYISRQHKEDEKTLAELRINLKTVAKKNKNT